jgi:hypothetical protein
LRPRRGCADEKRTYSQKSRPTFERVDDHSQDWLLVQNG